jgi:hypothetical protein
MNAMKIKFFKAVDTIDKTYSDAKREFEVHSAEGQP